MQEMPININNNFNEGTIIVRASDILKKLRSPQDRKNFALENSNLLYNIYKLIFRLVHPFFKRIRCNIFTSSDEGRKKMSPDRISIRVSSKFF